MYIELKSDQNYACIVSESFTGSEHGPFSIVDGWGGSSDWSINGTVDILAWKMDNFHRSFQTVFTVTKNSSTQSCLQFQEALDLNNFLISVKVLIT